MSARIEDLATHPAKHVTPRQLAEYWGFSVETIIGWIRAGRLKAFRPGGHEWRIRTDEARAREGMIDREAS